jgi:hypothetical protein
MPNVGFELTANNAGLISVLKESTDAIKSAAGGIAGAFSPVTAAFGALKGAMVGITAAFAGGALFKDAVNTTAELASSSISLGLQLGVSATRASDLKVALASVGVSQDEFAAAGAKVTRTLVSHEDAFQRLGVATRDQQGNYRSTIDIIIDVNTALAGLQEGTDRNTEAQRIYGKGWQEIMPTLRATQAVMDEAKGHAQALGLEVGQEQVANFIQYRSAMAGVQEVFRGVMNAIGETLMPSLTALGNWFGSIGPGLVEIFRFAISGIALAFEAIMLPISLVFDTIKAGIRMLTVDFLMLADIIDRALHGDWNGVKAAWKEGQDQITQINKEWGEKIVSDATEAHDRMAALIAGHVATPIPEPTGQKAEKPPEKESRVPQWQEELAQQEAAQAQQLAAQGEFHEVSKADELAYWQNILATNNTSVKEKLAIGKTIANLELGIAKEAFDAQLAGLKEQEAQYKNNLDAKLTIAKEYAQRVGEAYGFESKQYNDAAKEVVTIEREKVAQLAAIDAVRRQATEAMATAEIDSAEKVAQLNVSLHRETEEQLLAQEKGFEDERYAIKREALQRSLDLASQDPDKNPTEIAKINAQIEALATQHAATLEGINIKLVQQQQQGWTNLFGTIETAFTQNISKMLEGTQTFQQSMTNIFSAIGDQIIQTLVRMAAQWAVTHLANLAVSRTTAEATILANAAVAGSAGVSSFAGAPWPLDLGAPGFGLSMEADAASYNLLGERGFDVPAGMMPKMQLHPKETVLPADIAETYRKNAPGNGGGGGENHFHLSAIDAKSLHDMVMDKNTRKSIAKTLIDHTRSRR